MRNTFAMLALAASVTTSVQAQRAWQPEIGIQGGYTQTKPAGTGADDANKFITFPGPSTVVPLLTYGSIYAIIPWGEKMAVEPTFGFSQFTVVGSATATRIGARINYAITPDIYGAAGGVFNYFESAGASGTQLGLQVGLGYRLRVSQTLNGRIEAQWVTTQEGEDVSGPFNAYSVLVGVSTPLSARTGAPARARARSNSVWSRAIGFNGGYSRAHIIGGGDAVFMSAPGVGGSLIGLGVFAPGPTTLFAIFPIGRKVALEPGLDIASIDQGTGSVTGVALGGRLNYAFSRGWYGALGGQLAYASGSGTSASVFGGTLAWGNRFNLTSNLGGRVELNYLTFPQNDDLGAAVNTFSVMFGLMMPLR